MARMTNFDNINVEGYSVSNTTVVTKTNNTAITYTALEILGGLILRDPNGGARTDIMPSAASLIAELDNAPVGTSFEFVIRNTADAAETITMGGTPTGITYSGTMTIAQNNSRRFKVVITGPASATVYSLGTSVH